jgi:ectoine hydroxylase-related dioxygenase (phytanoyl-CoA dioxygenase family)
MSIAKRPDAGEVLWLDLPGARERAAGAATKEVERHAVELIDHGFTVIRGAVSAADCDSAVNAFQHWCTERPEYSAAHRDEDGHYPRLVNLHLAAPEVSGLFTGNERALEVQDFCFGFRAALYTSLFFERGTAQPIHRDIPYFRTEPSGFYFGVWTALENVDHDNGPLRVVDGGHRLPAIDAGAIGRRHFSSAADIPEISLDLWREYQGHVQTSCEQARLEVVELMMEKGDTVLWHPLTPHGGAPIRDPARTRFSVVFHTTPESVPVYQGDVFFNASAQPSPDPIWRYRRLQDRFAADLGADAHF